MQWPKHTVGRPAWQFLKSRTARTPTMTGRYFEIWTPCISPPVAPQDELLDALEALDGILQDPRYHPERDALYHSLQVFEHAKAQTQDPHLWAAALLHDIGKSEGNANHAARGADTLEGLMPTRVCWLVRHHMDLYEAGPKMRRRLARDARLQDLEALRRWDLAGRSPYARVISPEEAIEQLMNQFASSGYSLV